MTGYAWCKDIQTDRGLAEREGFYRAVSSKYSSYYYLKRL